MSHGKQFTLYSHVSGPNGWKPAILLDELGLSYETIYLNFQSGEQKAPEHTKHNPNGRIPTVIDHNNNDFVVWESNAVLLYLVGKYDKENRLGGQDENEKATINQWLFFQASGQGPYFGQYAWFTLYHPEKIQSAIDRYRNEILRVFGVLEKVLSNQKWLVGGRFTVADLSFVTWNNWAVRAFKNTDPEWNLAAHFPAVADWNDRLNARPSTVKVLGIREELLAKK